MPIQDVDLYELARDHYTGYSAKTNEDRMISSVADGLKPVQRRILWALWENRARSTGKTIKAAKVVGHTLGNYHPHGDSSVYGAMQTMVASMSQPLIHGEGNWGSVFGDPAAAYRYTECKLTKFSETLFFHPFYLPAMRMANNFNDDSTIQEPVDLPARLPHYLINGGMGIGVGIKGEFPSFTVSSLIATLKHYLTTSRWDTSLLELCSRYNAAPVNPQPAIDALFSHGKAPVTFSSTFTVNDKERAVYIRDSFPDINLRTAMSRIMEKESHIRSVDDVSSPHDRFATIRIEAKRTLRPSDIPQYLADLCSRYFTGTSHFDMYMTLRSLPKGAEEVGITLATANVQKVLETWLTFRATIEKRACRIHYRKLRETNHRLSLLMLAADRLDDITSALRLDLTRTGLCEHLQASLGISFEDAAVIVDMKVHQLRKLERDDLKSRVAANEETMFHYRQRAADTNKAILDDLTRLENELR